MATGPDRQRALRRRRRRERQAVVFGSLVAGLLVAGFGAAAVYTDVLDIPFVEREFSTPPAPPSVAVPIPPCPAADALPVGYADIEVKVLNGTSRQGLASVTAEGLTDRGFVVSSIGNTPVRHPGEALILFGTESVAEAYTLAAQFTSATLQLDKRTETGLDLVIGEAYEGLLDPTAVLLDPETPLAGAEDCVALEVALADAAPAPTPSPTAATTEDTEDADGA